MATLRRLATLTAATIVSQVIQLGIFIMASRLVGPFELGNFAVCLIVSNLTVGIFDFGRTTFFTRELAFGRLSEDGFWIEVKHRFLALLILCLAGSIIFFIIGNELLSATSFLVFSQYTFQTLQALAKSRVNIKRLSISIVIDRSACALAVALLLLIPQTTTASLVLCWVFGQLLGCWVVAFRRVRPRANITFVSLTRNLSIWKSFHIGVQSLSTVFTALDQVILAWVRGSGDAGIFAAVSKWFTSFSILGNSFSTVTLNQAANKQKTISDYLKSERRVIVLLGSICLAVISVSFLFNKQIVEITLGEKFSESAKILPILSISATLALVVQVISSILQYYGLEKITSTLNMVFGGVYLAFLPVVLVYQSNQGPLLLAFCQLGFEVLLLTSLMLASRRGLRRRAN